MSTWIKLHDNFWENPKVLAAGEDAALLYIQGLSYCSRNLTDGAIPTPALRNLTAKKDARTLARILVREGLWIETATGWTIHDYLKVQRSRAQVESEREKARERAAKRREVRPKFARTSPESAATVRVPETETETDPPLTPPPVTFEPVDTSLAPEQVASLKQGLRLVRDANPLARSPHEGEAQARGGDGLVHVNGQAMAVGVEGETNG